MAAKEYYSWTLSYYFISPTAMMAVRRNQGVINQIAYDPLPLWRLDIKARKERGDGSHAVFKLRDHSVLVQKWEPEYNSYSVLSDLESSYVLPEWELPTEAQTEQE